VDTAYKAAAQYGQQQVLAGQVAAQSSVGVPVASKQSSSAAAHGWVAVQSRCACAALAAGQQQQQRSAAKDACRRGTAAQDNSISLHDSSSGLAQQYRRSMCLGSETARAYLGH
jgi:hypothetical protein